MREGAAGETCTKFGVRVLHAAAESNSDNWVNMSVPFPAKLDRIQGATPLGGIDSLNTNHHPGAPGHVWSQRNQEKWVFQDFKILRPAEPEEISS